MKNTERKMGVLWVLFFGFALMTAVIVLGIGYFVLTRDHQRFELEANRLRAEYTKSQKQLIKNEVDKVVDFIQYNYWKTEERLRTSIKERTYEAYAIATNLYNEHSGGEAGKQIRTFILDALRPIRFNGGRGYYFATGLDGVEMLFADHPELEGESLLDMQDTRGTFVIREMIELVRLWGEGYYRYLWTKPNVEGRDFPKIAYVKYFAPLNCFIGTGDYLDDVERDIQQEVLERIGEIRFGYNGYIFVVAYNGTTLMNGLQPEFIGKNISDMIDPYGVRVFQEERRSADKPGGDFIFYHWEKPSTKQISPKISFVRGFPQWGWLVGAGVYNDEVESTIAIHEAEARQKMLTDVFSLALILFGILLVSLFLCYYLSHYFKRQLDIFLLFFHNMEKGGVAIATKQLFLREFEELGKSANKMLDTRQRAEAELRESEEQLRAVFNSVQDFIFIKDANHRYRMVNNFFERQFQIDSSVLLGHTDIEIPIFEINDMSKEIIREADHSVLMGETVHYELTHRVCGTPLTFDIMKTPIRDEQGRVGSICGLARDITERKQAEENRKSLEERLQRAEKMEALGTMAGGVAHDLNNVLGVVVGYSELLLDEVDESTSARSHVAQILKGGERAAAIVQDLLTLTRRGVATRSVLMLNEIIIDCRNSPEFAKLSSYHPAVRISMDLDADLLNVSGSSVHLGKTFMNLVSNAAEAMPNGGLLTIKTSNQYLDKPVSGYDEVREGDYVVLSVSDTGEGIPRPELKRIFEPFYTKKVMGRSGTGLGLAVVWGTMKDHQGYINVESQEGKGTVFSLYFPVAREEIPPEEISISTAEYVGNGESILVVDDVKEQRELATMMLAKLNYRAESVSSGEEAVAYLRERTVDLIVLDMIMDPGMDGLDTYAAILRIHPHQKAIIVSGFSETDRVGRTQALGAGAYVKKPYVLEKLGLAVKAQLDRSE